MVHLISNTDCFLQISFVPLGLSVQKTFLLLNSPSSVLFFILQKVLPWSTVFILTDCIHKDSLRWYLIQADLNRRSGLGWFQASPFAQVFLCLSLFLESSHIPDYNPLALPSKYTPKWDIFHYLDYLPYDLSLCCSPGLLHHPPH